MTSHVLRAPQTIASGARRLVYIAIGLVAIALVVVALVSSSGSSTLSGSAVSSGRAVSVAHPNEAATAAAIGRTQDDAVAPGSGVALGRRGGLVHEPNLLPK